MTKEE